MILKGDPPKSKAAEAAQDASKLDSVAPPPYSAPSSTSAPDNIGLHASNFIAIDHQSRNIKGKYLVDPTLVIPAALLPPTNPGEDRKNLALRTDNGEVNVEITVPPVENYNGRVTLDIESGNGAIKCGLHRSLNHPPIFLHAQSLNGEIVIRLPRTFHGTVTATTNNGAITVSDAIASHRKHHSDTKNMTRFFIGDDAPLRTDSTWSSDELVVETHNGGIKFYYDDDPKLRSLWTRLFS